MLFIVSTPIGNLEDITLRAIRTIFSVDIVLCEDTRVSGNLLHHLRSHNTHPEKMPRLLPYHEYNEDQKLYEVVSQLEQGKNVALLSDSGTPLLSDPGYPLVKECIRRNIAVVAIPGASSVLAALVASGLPVYPFRFIGFAPEKRSHRIALFESLQNHDPKDCLYAKETLIFFASSHKIVRILEEMMSTIGCGTIVLARELTKVHEEMIRGNVRDVVNRLRTSKPKGEYVVLFSKKENLFP